MSNAQQFWNRQYKARKMVAPLEFTLKAHTYLEDQPGCSVLDIGCGDGRDSFFFAQQGYDVTAIDFSEEAINRVRAEHSPIKAQVMDIAAMEFDDASFDAAYAHLSLHYFDDALTNRIIGNIHRMLKPDGYFFIKCKSIHDPLYGLGEQTGPDMFAYPYTRHFFSMDYMQDKLRDFTILELGETTAFYDEHESAFVEAITRKS